MPSTSDNPATQAGNTLLQRMMNSDIPKTHFFRLLTIPHIAQPDLSSAITSQEDEDAMEMMPQFFAKEESQDPLNPLASPVWRPSGAWKWITGIGIRACKNVVTLTCDKKSSLYFGTGTIASDIKTESIQFLCKTWPLDANMKEFVTEVALHKCQMRALAGTYVPTIIGVFTGVGIANMLMELPHQAFWIQASTDMPDVLKKRCVEAYEKLHAAGILHGSPHLRHLLIGGDARVTIMNFERSRVLDPVSNTHISQAKADAAELRLEMRKVKYQLDYDDARIKEKQKWERYKARVEHSKREVLREATDPPSSVPQASEVLEVLEEDVLDPPIDTRRLKSWAPEKGYSSARFVVPTITPEAFANAVEKFIANIRRLEREGDGPPPSRSPSPDPPGIQPFRDQPLVDPDPNSPSPEKPPAPRRSSRKRKDPADDAESPPKRRKTVVICPPLPITPAASMESAAAALPTKPITVESFIGSSPTISSHDTAISSDGQTNSTEVLPCEPGPSNLRSALKSPARPTFPMSDDNQEPILSPVTRGKRKWEEGADDLDLEVEASLPKRTRLASPTKDGKHVSFAPAPDVHLKNYTIPPHLLTKPQKRRHRRSMRWRSSSTHFPMLDTSDAYGMGSHGETKQPWWLESNFTFAFPPPLGFRFVSRWLKDMIHRIQS